MSSEWQEPCPFCPMVFFGEDRSLAVRRVIDHARSSHPVFPPFTAVVTDAGGGVVNLNVARDTVSYPRVGDTVEVRFMGLAP